MSIALSLLVALLLDYWFKEPKRFHPLVGFGNMASLLEKRFNLNDKKGGVIAWCLAVLPWVFLGFLLQYSLLDMPVLMAVVAGVVLYFGLGWQSLLSHGMAIAEPLKRGDLQAARQAVSMIRARGGSDRFCCYRVGFRKWCRCYFLSVVLVLFTRYSGCNSLSFE